MSSSVSSSACHIHTLPKDVLLRAIAPLLYWDEIFNTARSSQFLLQSMHDVDLRLPVTMREWVQRCPEECRSFLAALAPNEISTLKEVHGWMINDTTAATSRALGRFSSLRWRIGTVDEMDDPEFLLAHLHHLPRSVRSMTFAIDPQVRDDGQDFSRLRLPSHLTELYFDNARNLPVEEIEKLNQLEVLKIDMELLMRRGANADSAMTDVPPSSSESSSSLGAALPLHRTPVFVAFPASVRTLILSKFPLCVWEESAAKSTPAALPSFVWPPALTSLELTSSVTVVKSYGSPNLKPKEIIRFYELFTRLPATVTRWSFDSAEMHTMFAWLIQQNRLPMALETVELTHPLQFETKPKVWKVAPPRAVVRTMKFQRLGAKGKQPIVVPLLNGTAGMSTLTSLTLPFGFQAFQQLREFLSLTHLADLNCDSLKGIVFPPSLERLEMGGVWLRSLTEESWQPPPALTSIYLGPTWSMPLTSLRLPPTIKHIRFGFNFDRAPPADYIWPPLLASLTFTSMRTAGVWPAYASSVPAGCRICVPLRVDSKGGLIGERLVDWSEGYQCKKYE